MRDAVCRQMSSSSGYETSTMRFNEDSFEQCYEIAEELGKLVTFIFFFFGLLFLRVCDTIPLLEHPAGLSIKGGLSFLKLGTGRAAVGIESRGRFCDSFIYLSINCGK